MFTPDQLERIDDYCVEQEKRETTDEQLWEQLHEINKRAIGIQGVLPLVYGLAFSFEHDYKDWRRLWNGFVLELNADLPVKELIIWHLTKRGDKYIERWVKENEEFMREHSKQAQIAAWHQLNA